MAVGFAHGFFYVLMWMAWIDGSEVRKMACSNGLRVSVVVVGMVLERASVGFILGPRLNGVLMALEGGGCRKVHVSVTGDKTGRNWRKMGGGVTGGVTNWGYILWVTGVTKLLPGHTVRGGKNEPKNGVEYRKQTLSVQLCFSIYLIIYRIKW